MWVKSYAIILASFGLILGATSPSAAASMSELVTGHRSDVAGAVIHCGETASNGLPFAEQLSQCLEQVEEIRRISERSDGEYGHAPTQRWADAFADEKSGAIYMIVALKYLENGGGTLAADTCQYVLLAQQSFTQIPMDEAREKEWFSEGDYALMGTADRVAANCLETFPDLGA